MCLKQFKKQNKQTSISMTQPFKNKINKSWILGWLNINNNKRRVYLLSGLCCLKLT